LFPVLASIPLLAPLLLLKPTPPFCPLALLKPLSLFNTITSFKPVPLLASEPVVAPLTMPAVVFPNAGADVDPLPNLQRMAVAKGAAVEVIAAAV
jgi:hypothetical protein